MSDTVRILVADDHPLFREGAVNTLTGETDFEVVAEASTGEAAVTLAVELVPDIAILDLTMPGDGGIVATRRIAAQTSTTAILVLTVSEDTDDLLQALKAGARGYVVKGVSGDGMIHAVRSVIAGEVYVSPALASGILGEMIRNDTTDAFEELTPREREVLELVADGCTNREIGDRLFLAEKTVKAHMTNVLQNLHVRSRVEAALLAQRRELEGH
ncbi:MAG: response regulator transcription factor [Actinomycetota bacterium]|nr:response regulator transcription factor [Actinomycetota bacterium]